MADGRLRGKNLAEFGFVARAIAEVRRNGRRQAIGAAADRVAEPFQVRAPLLQRGRSRVQKRGALRVEDGAQVQCHRAGLVHSGGRAG